ncbi:MAG: radical SAM protein, partial [Actinobacteria bacterium]|nr:radical SAM protein [Actinomycetota bacterium]
MEDKESKDMLCDNFGRKIDYLRMSVTDRCNLRCVYCMPGEGIEMLGHGDMLSYEELLRAAKLFAEAGIKKIRLTGGEPLVRKDIITLVEGLKNIRQIEDVSLTTNGLLLRRHLKALSDKGINRLNISIDSMNPQKYAKITRGGNLGTLTDNIISAAGLGFKEIKLNVVITGFLDSSDIRDFINFARDYSLFLRFIEMMDYEPKSSNCATSYNHQGSSTVECCSSYIADSEEKISV